MWSFVRKHQKHSTRLKKLKASSYFVKENTNKVEVESQSNHRHLWHEMHTFIMLLQNVNAKYLAVNVHILQV